jgi:peptidoglycan/xylan/chitin deacetylase (PgdA/CDA1 family)
MKLVSPMLKHAVYPTLRQIGYLDRVMPPGGYAVANYHGVLPVDYSDYDPFLDANLVGVEVFRKQLQFLKKHYHVIHPEDFRASIEQKKSFPPRTVLVTCDDGLLNCLTDMLPVLQSEGVPCLFFVTGASCGETPGMLWYEELYLLMRKAAFANLDSALPSPALPSEEATTPLSENFQSRWWNSVRRASRLDSTARADWMKLMRDHCGPIHCPSEKRWRLLRATELRQMAEAGVCIGAHTMTHPVLSLCSEEEALREIQGSKHALEEAFEQTVWAFAYPFGNPATMGEREVRLAQQAGFTCAFLNVEHWPAQTADPYTLARTHISRDTATSELAAHLSGLHSRLQRSLGA